MDCGFYTGRFDGLVCPASDRWFCGGVARTAEFVTLAGSSEGQGLRLLGALAFVLFGLASALAVGCFVRLYGVVFWAGIEAGS